MSIDSCYTASHFIRMNTPRPVFFVKDKLYMQPKLSGLNSCSTIGGLIPLTERSDNSINHINYAGFLFLQTMHGILFSVLSSMDFWVALNNKLSNYLKSRLGIIFQNLFQRFITKEGVTYDRKRAVTYNLE